MGKRRGEGTNKTVSTSKLRRSSRNPCPAPCHSPTEANPNVTRVNDSKNSKRSVKDSSKVTRTDSTSKCIKYEDVIIDDEVSSCSIVNPTSRGNGESVQNQKLKQAQEYDIINIRPQDWQEQVNPSNVTRSITISKTKELESTASEGKNKFRTFKNF